MTAELRTGIGVEMAVEFPRALEIQTTTACNSGCVICPHHDVWPEGRGGEMADGLFERIISQCVPHQTGLRIIPYLNAEPLLDTRFARRLETIRRLCPAAEIEVSTNVSLLTAGVRRQLVKDPPSELRLSVFGFTPGTHVRMMPGLDWKVVWDNLRAVAEDDALRRAVREVALVMIEHPWVPAEEYAAAARFCETHGLTFHRWGFLDRAGNVARFREDIYHRRVAGCRQRRPFERLHVRFDGLVVLCCQDWRSTVVLGDLRRQTLNEVWTSPEYQRVRAALLGGEGRQPDICRRCRLAISP